MALNIKTMEATPISNDLYSFGRPYFKSHPFARGRKEGKLPPRCPYTAGYNIRTEKQFAARVSREYFPSGVEIVPKRYEKRAIAFMEGSRDFKALKSMPRPVRRLVAKWIAWEMQDVNDAMWRNAI